MGVKLFTSKLIKQQLPEEELQDLVGKFRKYKDSGDAGVFFGRDTYYDRPSSVLDAELWHAHLSDGKSGPFKLRFTQFNRTSNTALVYCPGFFKPDHILLIAILNDAHQLYRDKPNSWYPKLVEIAEGFRSQF
jgi:mRNA interferase YafO